MLIGLWALGWKKKIFSRRFWKVFFVINISWIILYNVATSLYQEAAIDLILFTLLSITALYLYAFNSSDIWDKKHLI